jgi:hypothetical protein
MKNFIVLMFMCAVAFAETNADPIVVELNISSYPDEYLAMTAKESCKGELHEAQIRASKLCYAWGHIMAVRNGFVMEDNVQLDYMLRVSNRDAYDFIEVDTELYECKKPLKHKKMLRPWKFVSIKCLTE